MVALDEGIGDVAGAVGKLGDVPALKVGAGGQDEVGEARFALHPDALTHDALQIRALVHVDKAVALRLGAEIGAAVAVIHAHRLMPRRGVSHLAELTVDAVVKVSDLADIIAEYRGKEAAN